MYVTGGFESAEYTTHKLKGTRKVRAIYQSRTFALFDLPIKAFFLQLSVYDLVYLENELN